MGFVVVLGKVSMGRIPRTLILWVVLIVLFVAFYRVFQADPGTVRAAPAAAPPNDSYWLTIATTWLPVFCLFLFFVFFVRRAQRLNTANREGIRLLMAGRYLAALEAFDALHKKHPKNLAFGHNVALAQLMLWRVADAQRTMEQLVKRAKPAQIEALGSVHAVIAAVGGDVAGAKTFVASAKARLDAGHYALAQAAIACRTGDFGAAITELDRFEVKQLGGFMAALAQALRAFATEKVNGQARPIDRVQLFGESGTEGLKLAWAELSELVARAPAA